MAGCCTSGSWRQDCSIQQLVMRPLQKVDRLAVVLFLKCSGLLLAVGPRSLICFASMQTPHKTNPRLTLRFKVDREHQPFVSQAAWPSRAFHRFVSCHSSPRRVAHMPECLHPNLGSLVLPAHLGMDLISAYFMIVSPLSNFC